MGPPAAEYISSDWHKFVPIPVILLLHHTRDYKQLLWFLQERPIRLYKDFFPCVAELKSSYPTRAAWSSVFHSVHQKWTKVSHQIIGASSVVFCCMCHKRILQGESFSHYWTILYSSESSTSLSDRWLLHATTIFYLYYYQLHNETV